MAGDVPLPKPTVVLSDGARLEGTDACQVLQPATGGDASPTTGLGIPTSTYLSLLKLPGAAPTHPAEEQVRFQRRFNPQYAMADFYRGTSRESEIASLPTHISSSLYPTPANAYAYAYADRTFGPNPDGHDILVLRGKAPTHPQTYNRNPRNDSQGKQVRYWSLCNYAPVFVAPGLGPANTDCLFDEQIPVDEDGYYTIVVSLAEDRPSNATTKCGVAWMDWTRKGDGIVGGHDRLIQLYLRQQLPSPTFAEAIENVRTPGTEQDVTGDYYPRGSYTNAETFERRGCDMQR